MTQQSLTIFGSTTIGVFLPPDWALIGAGLFTMGILTWTDDPSCIYNKKFSKYKAMIMRGIMGIILGNIAMSLSLPIWEHISVSAMPIEFKISVGLVVAFFQTNVLQFGDKYLNMKLDSKSNKKV